MGHMTTLKQSLQSDLTEAIRSRDELTSATLRMALSAITNEEVAGKTARELSDDEVVTVLGAEAKKRREAAAAFNRAFQAAHGEAGQSVGHDAAVVDHGGGACVCRTQHGAPQLHGAQA